MQTIGHIFRRIVNYFSYTDITGQGDRMGQEPVFMTLEEAMRDPDLVSEISKQTDNARLTVGSSNKYVAGIKYKKHQYYILGTHKEWESFFGDGSVGPAGKQMKYGI